MPSKLAIPQSEIEAGMPIRTVTTPILDWMADLEVLDAGPYPLPGGQERRATAGTDSRLKLNPMFLGGTSVGPKESDLITYYEHIATLHHNSGGYTFVAFRMTMDALLASQKDPARFPAWLMKHPVKQTELRIYFAVVKAPPLNVTSIYDWLVPVEDAFPGAEVWMYDALAYFLMQKGMAKSDFFRRA